MIINPLIEVNTPFPNDTLCYTNSPSIPAYTEAMVQQKIRLQWSEKGGRIWRNNVGAATDDNDRHIRYGLANDSARLNRKLKSSDLIGILPMVITQEMVGRTAGIFTSIEVKKSGWRYKGTDRERAQLAWLRLILGLGGISGFSTGEV